MPASIAPIILVEDDANDAFFVRYVLEQSLIRNPLWVFASAEEAREHLRPRSGQLTPALLLLDLNLSGPETGLDILTWLRQQPAPLGSTPVLMLTGSDRPSDREDSDRLGAMLYLQKPVTATNLTKAIQALGLVVINNITSGQLNFRIIEHRPPNPAGEGSITPR